MTPSLTAPAHIAIATGSTAAKNDVLANSFHLLASPFARNISGFSAPIGGYLFSPHGSEESPDPSAEPLWVALPAAGKKVVTATFPGADGLDIRVPGLIDSPVIQPARLRTVDYTVPFGAFAGLGAGASSCPVRISVSLRKRRLTNFRPPAGRASARFGKRRLRSRSSPWEVLTTTSVSRSSIPPMITG